MELIESTPLLHPSCHEYDANLDSSPDAGAQQKIKALFNRIRAFHWRILLTTIILSASGSFNFGVGATLLNPAESIMNEFVNGSYKSHYGHPMSRGVWLFVWPFIINMEVVGTTLGSLPVVQLTERLGRRRTFYVCGVVAIVGLTMQSISKRCQSFELLAAGRFVTSLSLGLCSIVEVIYYTEISPIHLRGFFISMKVVLYMIGNLAGTMLTQPWAFGTRDRWPWVFVVQMFPVWIMCIYVYSIPESPRYLLPKGRMKECRRSLRFFGHRDIESTVREIEDEIRCQGDNDMKCRELWSKPFLRRGLLQCILVQVIAIFSGIVAVEYYSTRVLMNAGLAESVAQRATVGIVACGAIATIVGGLLLDRVGRRPLLLCCMAFMVCTHVIATISTRLYEVYRYVWAAYVNVGAIVAFMVLFGLGPSTMRFLVRGECVPQKARSITQLISSLVEETSILINVLLYYSLQAALGGYIYLFYIVVLCGLFVVAWKCFVETKNLTMVEIMIKFGYREEESEAF